MAIDKRKAAAIAATALAVAICAGCAVRCSVVQQERQEQTAEQQAQQEAGQQAAENAASASEQEQEKAEAEEEARQSAEKKAKQLEEAKKQTAEEEREAARREAQAKAASTLVMLSDTSALESAGVPAKMAAQLDEVVSKWCAKRKLEAPSYIHKKDVSANGDKCTVALVAEKGVSEGSAEVALAAAWDGKKLKVSKEKGAGK